MIFSKWNRWVVGLLLAHIGALVGIAIVYGIIALKEHIPFYEIFEYPESAPYYITTYVFALLFALTFSGVGLMLRDIFGHKDFRAQLISRGLLVMSILCSLLPITLITMWDLALNQPMHTWSNLVLAAQYFALWITLIATVLYACIMLVLFFLGKEHASIPRGWSYLSLGLAVLGGLMALTCFGIPKFLLLFRIIYLIGGAGYLIWTIWLLKLIQKVERMP